MQSADPCVECSGTELKLIDGYYYCVECNTQNTNVRETVVEQKALGDGTFALTTRRKIVKIHDSKIEMSREWYKWHAYNFVISGLADELVAAGAKPTFKLKLLWIWTRYIKKYQNKDALRYENKEDERNNENSTLPCFMVEENSNSNPAQNEEENELENENKTKRYKNNVIADESRRDIKFLSKSLIVAMLYLALNLDESDIQLCHIYSFINEKRLNFSNIQRFLPEDIHIKSIKDEWLKFIHSKVGNMHRVRALAMSLLRKLDLGTPKVPNLRKMIDNFLVELCLPNDIKPMIYSLMFFHRCDFLDVSSKLKEQLVQTPNYECVAMSYVLVALKMCFGLDGEYEEKLSDAVDKINDEGNLSKSHRMGKYSEPSTRLFSFREWCSYMQLRKITLCKSCLHMAEQHCLDIDDCVYLEHMGDRPQNNKDLQDETAINLINRIHENDEGRVIPKHMFYPTLTPMNDYTEIIIEHNQDIELRGLLSEDFTQYSLNYACENLQHVDRNSENIIKGVSEEGKRISQAILGTIVTKKSKSEMVYVKNCENRNWMVSNPPKMEHVTCEDAQNVSNDKESDHGYDSENPVNEKEVSRETVNIDIVDQTLKEDNRGINGSKKAANDIEISEQTETMDEPYQTITEVSKKINDTKHTANNIELSEETENMNDTDQSMSEPYRGINGSKNAANDIELSEEIERMDETDQTMKEDDREMNDSTNSANDINIPEATGNMDDTDVQSRKENSRDINGSQNAMNEKEVSEEIVNVETDQSMREDYVNDLENPSTEKEVTENTVEITDQSLKEEKRRFIITEENIESNIFDDLFIELDIKDEIDNNVDDLCTNIEDQPLQIHNSFIDDRASISDVTDDDRVFAPFNPDTFDREQTIKELILSACKKHKIPIPREYKPPSEPRKRKANIFGNEETPKERRKRAKVDRFENKTKIKELISGYESFMKSDIIINKMQEAVNLAVQNTQLHGLLNGTPNETANPANVEQTSNGSSIITENVENQSNLNPNVSVQEQTDKQPNLDNTDNAEEIDEHWEAKLFEGEEEMQLDDLVPKGDPKFDEEKYDVNQLYIKIKTEDDEDAFNLQDVPPKLVQIINLKIEQCKDNTEFETLKPEPATRKTKYDSESEDDIPLNILQEEKTLIEQKISWEDNFEPLINEANVSEFKYYCRHYDEDFMTRSKDWHKKFDEELKENTPSSFYFVIRECAAILNCSTFSLYKNMQGLEKYLIAKAKCPD